MSYNNVSTLYLSVLEGVLAQFSTRPEDNLLFVLRAYVLLEPMLVLNQDLKGYINSVVVTIQQCPTTEEKLKMIDAYAPLMFHTIRATDVLGIETRSLVNYEVLHTQIGSRSGVQFFSLRPGVEIIQNDIQNLVHVMRPVTKWHRTIHNVRSLCSEVLNTIICNAEANDRTPEQLLDAYAMLLYGLWPMLPNNESTARLQTLLGVLQKEWDTPQAAVRTLGTRLLDEIITRWHIDPEQSARIFLHKIILAGANFQPVLFREFASSFPSRKAHFDFAKVAKAAHRLDYIERKISAMWTRFYNDIPERETLQCLVDMHIGNQVGDDLFEQRLVALHDSVHAEFQALYRAFHDHSEFKP